MINSKYRSLFYLFTLFRALVCEVVRGFTQVAWFWSIITVLILLFWLTRRTIRSEMTLFSTSKTSKFFLFHFFTFIFLILCIFFIFLGAIINSMPRFFTTIAKKGFSLIWISFYWCLCDLISYIRLCLNFFPFFWAVRKDMSRLFASIANYTCIIRILIILSGWVTLVILIIRSPYWPFILS